MTPSDPKDARACHRHRRTFTDVVVEFRRPASWTRKVLTTPLRQRAALSRPSGSRSSMSRQAAAGRHRSHHSRHHARDQRADRAQGCAHGAADHRGISRHDRARHREPVRSIRRQSRQTDAAGAADIGVIPLRSGLPPMAKCFARSTSNPFCRRSSICVASRSKASRSHFFTAMRSRGTNSGSRDLLQSHLPNLSVSLSSEVSPEMREYERFTTTCANAYVQPLIAGYLARLDDELEAAGSPALMFLMLSSGGLTTVETASAFPNPPRRIRARGWSDLCAALSPDGTAQPGWCRSIWAAPPRNFA